MKNLDLTVMLLLLQGKNASLHFLYPKSFTGEIFHQAFVFQKYFVAFSIANAVKVAAPPIYC